MGYLLPDPGVSIAVCKAVALSLKPGDVLAVLVPQVLSKEQRQHLIESLDAGLPNIKVIVFDGGITLATISGNTGHFTRPVIPQPTTGTIS